ncbi:MAG: HD domain-containing protein [Chloroflexi bacterium]|nr:HD domain-containing protein [Chloroflexota bacterium]
MPLQSHQTTQEKTAVKKTFVSDLQAGNVLEHEPFLLQDAITRKTKDGRDYLLGNLRDKSGQVTFVYWDVPEYVFRWAQPGHIVLVTGRINNYKDSLQITITDLNECLNPDLAAFLPTSSRPREVLVAELKDIVGLLAEPWRALVTQLLLADTVFLHQFSIAPAARKMHHAYLGGLLEHSLSMANLAHTLADHYPHVNRDLLVTGALLHDIGKAIEYDVAQGFSFSDDGRLVGHIVRAVVLIEQAAHTLDAISDEDLRQLIHLVTSHHGTLEWGSPITPKTLEAILLHQIDLLDSRIQGYFDHLNDDVSQNDWTAKASPMFGTELRYPNDYPRSSRAESGAADHE